MDMHFGVIGQNEEMLNEIHKKTKHKFQINANDPNPKRMIR
jgi:hypothetical protein